MKTRRQKLAAFIILVVLLTTAFLPRENREYDLSADRIRQDTLHLCNTIGIRVTGTDKEREAADWIAESLADAGFAEGETMQRIVFAGAKDMTSENILAVCNPGSSGPLYSIVAHYDSVSTSAGARDNAASVAALLEIARYLGAENQAFPCEIRMVFLGSEENGYHGSAAYVESLTDVERNRHAAAFNMDISAASDNENMVLVCNTLGCVTEGMYQEGNFINPAEGALVNAVRDAYRLLYGKNLGGVFHFGESDHVSFHNVGLEAANICWRKVDSGMPVLPESYHQMTDTPEQLNYDTVRTSARCILKAMELLCK